MSPKKISKKIPRTLARTGEIKCISKLPANKDNIQKKKEIPNRMHLEEMFVFVFFNPYVIPIPIESTLRVIANKIEFKNMKNTSSTYYVKQKEKWKKLE